MAARARGIPTLLWEGNVIPGKSTAAVGRWATRVAVSFPPTLAAFPGRGFVSGTPIRSFAGIDRGAARAAHGVGPEDRLLLIFGGSQAVPRIAAALEETLESLLRDWHILHLTGDAGRADGERLAARLTAEQRNRYRPLPFLTDGMAEALIAADLVLGRAGSSTCAEVAAVGVASILVPYPHAGAHQAANAAWLAEAGATVVVPDAELDAERLRTELAGLRDDERRAAMATAAGHLGRADAADRLARELLAMADGTPLTPPEAAE
jgi:UDP-N-acetylglucosamine--N-acetylmuramyl-(pentapeptide) pyrophosphoryl-undecaprenol N-acetylglucosamine transferase